MCWMMGVSFSVSKHDAIFKVFFFQIFTYNINVLIDISDFCIRVNIFNKKMYRLGLPIHQVYCIVTQGYSSQNSTWMCLSNLENLTFSIPIFRPITYPCSILSLIEKQLILPKCFLR